MKEQHVGIMGGTFDPIHHGHLILAQTAMEQFQLDQILFMPTRTPPHKSADVTDPRHRIAMTELAINLIRVLPSLPLKWSGRGTHLPVRP